jgi:hypothetical protein
MRSWRPVLAFLAVIVLGAGSAGAFTITANPATIGLGETLELSVILDPEGLNLEDALLTFEVSTVSEIVVNSISVPTLPTGCDSVKSDPGAAPTTPFSVNIQCVGNPVSTAFAALLVNVTGVLEGGTLELTGASLSDSDFNEFTISPDTLATVVPEPSTASLLCLGMAALASGNRRLRR